MTDCSLHIIILTEYTENSYFPKPQTIVIAVVARYLLDTNPITKEEWWAREICWGWNHYCTLSEAEFVISFIVPMLNTNTEYEVSSCKYTGVFHHFCISQLRFVRTFWDRRQIHVHIIIIRIWPLGWRLHARECNLLVVNASHVFRAIKWWLM